MTSVSVVPTSGLRGSSGNVVGVDRLPGEMNDMKIRDDKEMVATVFYGNETEAGRIIVTTIGGKISQTKEKKLNSSISVPKQLMLNQETEKKRKVILEASRLQEICIVMVKSHPSEESELKAGAEFFESNTTLNLATRE